jgi:hypothetical protein
LAASFRYIPLNVSITNRECGAALTHPSSMARSPMIARAHDVKEDKAAIKVCGEKSVVLRPFLDRPNRRNINLALSEALPP